MATTGCYLTRPVASLDVANALDNLVSLCVTLEFTHPFVPNAAVAIAAQW